MPDTTTRADIVRAADPLSPGRAWYLVGALALASMVSYVDRQILTLLFAPIKADLKLSDTEVSLLVGLAFVLCYSVFGLFSGWLADRSARKWLVTGGIAFWSAATAACGAASSFVTLFAARMAVGVGEATLSPSAMSMMTDAFPRDRLARAMSVYTAAAFVGMGMAMILGGVGIGIAGRIVDSGAPVLSDMRPWQVAFILVGAVGGLAVLPMLFVTEPPRGVAAIASPDGPPLGRFLKANLGTFGFLWTGYSLAAMAGVGTMTWTPTYFIRTFGLTAPQIGLAYGAIVSVIGMIGVMSGPTVFDFLKRRGMRDGYVVFPVVCLSIGAMLSICAFSAPTMPAALGLIAVKELIMTLPMPIMAMSMQIIAPSQIRGRTSAMYLFMGNILAAAVGPVTVALLTDQLYRDESRLGLSIITNTAILAPLASLCLFMAIRPYRKSLADADAGFVRTY